MTEDHPTFLIGGGWQPECRDEVYGPFLSAAGTNPTVTCIVWTRVTAPTNSTGGPPR